MLIGTCSLATVKRLHQHSSVNPMESPDVTVYHSLERCCLYLVIHSVCPFVCLYVNMSAGTYVCYVPFALHSISFSLVNEN